MYTGGFFFLAGVSLLSLFFIRKSVSDLPGVERLESYVPPLVTKVVDSFGLSVGEFYFEIDRESLEKRRILLQW